MTTGGGAPATALRVRSAHARVAGTARGTRRSGCIGSSISTSPRSSTRRAARVGRKASSFPIATWSTGAMSVAEYLENTPDDRLLAVLPFSFDYGFSQLTTAFHVGASVDADRLPVPQRTSSPPYRRTGSPDSPPYRRCGYSSRICRGPTGIDGHLRYITNSGGRMPRATLDKLRAAPAAHAAVPDVRAHRGVPRHVSAAGGDRPAARFDGQGDSERGDPRRPPRRHTVRSRRAWRARAARLAGRARLLERPGEDRRAVQAGARPARRAAVDRDGGLVRRYGAQRMPTDSCTSSAAATR